MEAVIIVEVFKCSVAMYGVKYHQLIGDEDSSVMRQLDKAKRYVVLRKTLSDRLQHFRCAITRAIRYRESQVGINEEQHIRELCTDFQNGPFHVFGDHSKCPARGYFCNGFRSGNECIIPNVKSVGKWDEIMPANDILSHNSESLLKNMTKDRA
ncbi:hypothetical protein PR048_018785 [Dryococelus australis]|uniref:Mutator-like transposase domain-containing protein n=1 Tax=Dryococelus australis TaxID=614101 RepID=A0ABQ9H1Q1_9NEOP|nr:hypothetical protein PR048_018785 [Dryococelus australis]